MNLREVYKAFGGERSKEHASEFYSASLRMYIDLLTQIREAYGAVAGAVLTRKSRGHFGADDSSGSIARLADDIPIDSLKSDIRRKKSLRQVMGPKHEDEEIVRPDESDLDDFLGLDDADTCHDDVKDAHGRCPSDVDYDEDTAGQYAAENATEADMGDEKANKEDVNYRYSPKEEESCGRCKHFESKTSTCEIVSGLIRASDTCDKWEAGPLTEAMRTFKKLYKKP